MEDVTSRSARLRWSPLSCEDRGDANVVYLLKLSRRNRDPLKPSGGEGSMDISTNRTWVMLMQLSPVFEYSVEVMASNRFGSGPPANLTFLTPSEELSRPIPTFLPIEGLTPTQATIKWTIPNDSPGIVYPALQYCELKVTPADQTNPILSERYINCSQSSKTIKDLRPYTRYLIEVS